MTIIDNTDRKILDLLQENGRIAASHIAVELNISIPTVTERIKKITRIGYHSGISCGVGSKKIGLGCCSSYHCHF